MVCFFLFKSQEVNVYNLWRKVLEENEKIAKARLAAVQVSTTGSTGRSSSSIKALKVYIY